MLAVSNAKYPEVATEKTGLQELAFTAEFDAAICVDAMEKWVNDAGLRVLEDGRSIGDGYGYYHLLTRAEAE